MKVKKYVIIVMAIFLMSCNKDNKIITQQTDGIGKYYLKFKVNGAQKEDYITSINDNGSAGFFDESSIFEYYDGHYEFQAQNIVGMGILNEQLELKTYHWKGTDSATGELRSKFHYFDPETDLEFWRIHNDQRSYMALTITSISNNEIKGTFSGKFFARSVKPHYYDPTVEKSFNITDGVFFMPLQ